MTSQYFFTILFSSKEAINMSFSYKPLWKLLIDKDMSKKDLMSKTGISKSTMDKMGRSEIVSLEVIDRICNYFDCSIDNVVEHFSRKENENGN